MKTLQAVLLIALSVLVINQKPEGWEIFEKVTFKPRYFKEVDANFDVPTFNKELIDLEDTEITLSGFYIPLELDSVFMLSALPYSSCFFCGGAGPETVAEIRMAEIPKRIVIDQFVKVSGTLKLNSTNIDFMNFILEDAKIIK
ncbi:hypothetical protein [Roseivirga misakiensis]|uniref:DUF3299 domain-containing protein n=1 Tax=Roseivirga misakiensis TaxID=1563681 RepID=A0A1E5SY20_9BACT|nr:hypothetical protein [Roseivirga misakiensis]OEK04010.1 hypothetical protein BFP71_10970 [Roseivirga misakiensis]